MAELSLVIVTHDSAADIVECLQAVARQRGAPPFETIVVDNGSRDGTPALVRKRFPRVRVVEQANLGFGAGNNRGAREATGDVLAFLNPDTVAEPGFLAALHAAVAPRQAATAQMVLRSDPARVNTWGNRLHFTGFSFVRGYREPRLPPGPPQPVAGLSGAAFAMRRADFEAIGGFDEDYFLYMEDTDLSWRLHRAGHRIVLAPSAVAAHDYDLAVPPWKVAYLEEGRLLLLRKHLPWHLWLGYLPALALASLLAWTWAARHGRAGLAAKAKALRRGWRRGLRRQALPRLRPHAFATRRIPFKDISGSRLVHGLGAVVNLLFVLNTPLWGLRRRHRRHR